jgi:phosphatidylinositol alpha-mannosyltransferase
VSVRRVALVSPYALSVFGGVQEQVLAMSRELSSRSIDVLVVAPGTHSSHYDTLATVETFGSVLKIPANGSRAPLTLSPAAAWRASRAVASFRPDVIHFHEPFAPLIGWRSLNKHRSPSVATFHRSGWGPGFQLTGPLLRLLAQGIDRGVAVSQAASSTIARGAKVPTEVLFNGFETDRLRAADRVTTTEPTVLFIGRLEQRKGVDTLLKAVLDDPSGTSAQWRVLVAGDGPLRRELELLSAGDKRISFLGAVGDEEKLRLLRSVDVLVAPSTHGESFGLVLLEAMAAETRVVASDIEGYREAAGAHAVLFSAGDPFALRRAIEEALSQTSITAINDARVYAEKWSMKRLMDRYLEIYEYALVDFAKAN